MSERVDDQCHLGLDKFGLIIVGGSFMNIPTNSGEYFSKPTPRLESQLQPFGTSVIEEIWCLSHLSVSLPHGVKVNECGVIL